MYLYFYTVFENHGKSLIFNIVSEASYVYILSGLKFIKNAKNGQFREFLKTKSLRSNSVMSPDMSLLK